MAAVAHRRRARPDRAGAGRRCTARGTRTGAGSTASAAATGAATVHALRHQRSGSALPTPKKKLSGCALTAIIGGGLLLVLVPIVAILVTIALPAYNDYTLRAKVAGAVTALQPLKDQVQHFADDEGRCPGGNDAGFPAPGDFAHAGLSAVNIGRFNNGHCGIEATLALPGKSLDGDLLWLEYDRDSGRWECSGESTTSTCRRRAAAEPRTPAPPRMIQQGTCND